MFASISSSSYGPNIYWQWHDLMSPIIFYVIEFGYASILSTFIAIVILLRSCVWLHSCIHRAYWHARRIACINVMMRHHQALRDNLRNSHYNDISERKVALHVPRWSYYRCHYVIHIKFGVLSRIFCKHAKCRPTSSPYHTHSQCEAWMGRRHECASVRIIIVSEHTAT